MKHCQQDTTRTRGLPPGCRQGRAGVCGAGHNSAAACQQAHEEADAFALPALFAVVLLDRLTSTSSSCRWLDRDCMPGSAAAIFLNRACMQSTRTQYMQPADHLLEEGPAHTPSHGGTQRVTHIGREHSTSKLASTPGACILKVCPY